ncbi:hypothetical protein Btru_006504 [Bulinus truncatus]|nr:hypothetical protein Btru_006504 [Bulinus truncatus]
MEKFKSQSEECVKREVTYTLFPEPLGMGLVDRPWTSLTNRLPSSGYLTNRSRRYPYQSLHRALVMSNRHRCPGGIFSIV